MPSHLFCRIFGHKFTGSIRKQTPIAARISPGYRSQISPTITFIEEEATVCARCGAATVYEFPPVDRRPKVTEAKAQEVKAAK